MGDNTTYNVGKLDNKVLETARYLGVSPMVFSDMNELEKMNFIIHKNYRGDMSTKTIEATCDERCTNPNVCKSGEVFRQGRSKDTFRFKQASDSCTRFVPVGRACTIERIKAFKDAFNDISFTKLYKYLGALPETDELNMDINYELAWLLFSEVWTTNSCMSDLSIFYSKGNVSTDVLIQKGAVIQDVPKCGIMSMVKGCQDGHNIVLFRLIIADVKYVDQHANFIIVDKEKREFEIFEPHGLSSINARMIDDIKKKLGHRGEIYKYLSPGLKDALTVGLYGPQSYECTADEGGYCAAFGFLFALMRLANPQLRTNSMASSMVLKHMKDKVLFNQTNTIPIIIRKFVTLLRMMIPDIRERYKGANLLFKTRNCFGRYREKIDDY